jgi:hypothetical protein
VGTGKPSYDKVILKPQEANNLLGDLSKRENIMKENSVN